MNWDLRKHDPYSVYPRMDFDVVVGDNGDAYDRGRVRLLECYESAQASSSRRSRRWPAAPFKADGLPRLIAPAPGDAYDHIESRPRVARRLPRLRRLAAAVPHEGALARPSATWRCSRSSPSGHTLVRPRRRPRFARPRVRGGGPVTPLLYGMLVGLVAGLVIAVAALIGVWGERKVVGAHPDALRAAGGRARSACSRRSPTRSSSSSRRTSRRRRPTCRSSARMPFLVFVPIAAALVVIPFAAGWAPFNIATGALFFLAVPGLSRASASCSPAGRLGTPTRRSAACAAPPR